MHVHHEGLGPDGAVGWFFAYKTNSYAINNPEPLSTGRHRFCFVFHLVRHPLRVVSSIVKASRKPFDVYWQWVSRVEPRVCGGPSQCKKMPLLQRSARQWLVWNQHMETFADVRSVSQSVSQSVISLFSLRVKQAVSVAREPTLTHNNKIQCISSFISLPCVRLQVSRGGYVSPRRVSLGRVPRKDLRQ